MWIYKQSTGQMFKAGSVVGVGYSGFGICKNEPDSQGVHNLGPIPQGNYEIGPMYDSEEHGPRVMRLTPWDDTETFGRSGFLIHGDSIPHPGTASKGCVVQPRNVREQIAASGDTTLEVIA